MIRFLIAASLFLSAGDARADALERLDPEKLQAAHRAVEAFKREREQRNRPAPYHDFRANLHVHSGFSHDSRGKIEDIVASAKSVGTRVLMFTEHPADHYDFFKDGHQGVQEGVLLVAGAEMKGFLVFPTGSLRGLDSGSPQEFSELVRGRGGLMFLSHLEERMDWKIGGLTGCEIYNTHADFKDEKKLVAALANPLWLIQSAEQFRKFPQEAFSALQDYPADYLRKWDELCEQAPHTGVSANDSHQNVGIVVRLKDGGKGAFEDALGKSLFELDLATQPRLKALAENKQPGDVVFDLRLDRYEYSLRHVSTHLLMKDLTREAVWEALDAGRAYVGFDWIADPAGFDFGAVAGGVKFEMGNRPALVKGLRLTGHSPLPTDWKLIRNGKVIFESRGKTLDYAVTEIGIYRVEAWLQVAGKNLPWILANPIYVGR